MRFTKVFAACAAVAVSTAASAQTVTYNNLTTFTGQVFSNGGSVNQAGNTITRMVADDINIASPTTSRMTSFTFTVTNLNATAVSARPLVRFYDNNGAGGLPGTFLGGFNFNAINFAGLNLGSFSFNLPAPLIIDGTFWAAITFDNNTGATGATQAQLNNLGQGIFNPPTVGSSQDAFWYSDAAGGFVVNNPVGQIFNFNGNPVANFGWQFTTQPVPEPGVLAMIGGIGAFALIRRRRTV